MGFLLLSKGCIPGPHDFVFVSGLAFRSGCSGPHDLTLVFHLSPTLVSHSSRSGMLVNLSPTCLPHLSPTLGALGRMIWHLSSTCLPHLSPTLGALGRMIWHLSSTCLPHLSPTLGALGRMLVEHWALLHLFGVNAGIISYCTLYISHSCRCSCRDSPNLVEVLQKMATAQGKDSVWFWCSMRNVWSDDVQEKVLRQQMLDLVVDQLRWWVKLCNPAASEQALDLKIAFQECSLVPGGEDHQGEWEWSPVLEKTPGQAQGAVIKKWVWSA